jgi:hypothetical protein
MNEPNCKVVFGYNGYRLIVHRYPGKWYSLHKGDRPIVSSRNVIRIALNIAIRRLPMPAPILANLPPILVRFVRFVNFLKKFEVNLRKGVRKIWERRVLVE